jgi:hypothetical protein
MTDFFEFQGSVDVVYDGLFPNGQLPGIGKMSLDALSGLRKTNEEFLPTDLFVRSEMLLVWNLLDKNEGNSAVQSQILLGSAGVGKSVLCFLQAVRMAYRGKRVLYFRKTKAESDTSLWCMERSGNDVRIRFDRSVEKGVEIWKLKIPAMLYCFSDLFPAGTKKDVFSKALKSKEVLVFVDGPNHAAAADTLFGKCTLLLHIRRASTLKKRRSSNKTDRGDERVAVPGFQESTRHRQDLRRHECTS